MRLVQRCFLGALCTLATLAVVACKRDHVDRDGYSERNFDQKDRSGVAGAPGERVGTTTVTGADVNGLSNAVAVERIVAARCARETACNNIGSDKHFVNHDVCARELQAKIGDDLKPSECPRGIDAAALDKCMDAIRTESCNNPIETIQRLAACRTSDMCIKN